MSPAKSTPSKLELPGRPTAVVLAAGWLAFAAASAAPGQAEATPPRISDGIRLPSKGVAGTDDASAIAVNPANLALSPGVEARFTWIQTGDESSSPVRGYALDLGLPFWFLATGLRLDWVIPPPAAPPPFASGGVGHRYNWVRWAAAVRLGDVFALGNTLAWSNASSPGLDELFSASSGLTLRPARFLSLAFVAHDWNSPEGVLGTTAIEPSFDFGLALRPLDGHKLLELGGEASYRTGSDDWVPRLQLGVDIPYVGRLRSGIEIDDPARWQFTASAGLDVNIDSLQVSGGLIAGNTTRSEGVPGAYAGVALRAFSDKPAIPPFPKVVRWRIETTPTVRQHTKMLRTLWRLAHTPEVDGLVLVLRAPPAPSLAHAEELVDALRLLKRAGKKVLCHLEDAGGRELFVCSEADRIAMNPAGGLRFAGLSSRYLYLGGLLDKLGVRADFVRIGRHKGAPETIALEGGSPAAKKDREILLRTIEHVYLAQVSRGRGLSPEALKQTIATGPFIAPEARAAKLVDTLAYEDEIERFAGEAFDTDSVRLSDVEKPDVAPSYWQSPPKVAVVYLDGDMVDGQSRTIPLIGIKLAGSYTVAKALKQAREDSSVRAVVLRVETGGGSSLAADVILREAALTAKAKPLIVSMGSTAASGGYYASVAGREIFANRATITGSIGIFYGKVDVSGLLGKLGIRTESIRSAPRADAESLFRTFTDEERTELGKKVKQFYDLFIGRVAEGRSLDPARVHEIGQGRVWTGEQAKDRRLVDQIGGLRQALDRARVLGGLPKDAPFIELPVQEPSLLEIALELLGVPLVKADATGWVPPPFMDVARALVPFLVYEPHKPLARIELMVAPAP